MLRNLRLFSFLYFSEWEHDSFIHPGLSEAEHQLKSNMVIEWVMKLSGLSGHRLEEVDLSIKSFVADYSLSALNWKATKLSIVLNLLRMSSNSLKRLNLELNSQQSSEASLNLIHSINHVSNIVKNLEPFKALQEVSIAAELNFNLVSGSLSDRRVLDIMDSEGRSLFDTEWELQDGYDSALRSLFKQVNTFTGRNVKKLDYTSRSGRCSYALKRLEDGKGALEELGLDFQGRTEDYEEALSLVITYPNLQKLHFAQYKEDILQEDARDFKIPNGARSASKLSSVIIELEEGQICLNDGFWKWIGGQNTLQSLVLQQPFHDGAPRRKISRNRASRLGNSRSAISTSIDFQSFQSLLLISASSLTTLDLQGLYLAPGMVKERLRFPKLRFLHLKGNFQLINVVLKAEYHCLQTLTLTCEGSQSSWIDHHGIVKALGTCRDAIQYISVRVVQSSQEAGFSLTTESSNFERMEVLDRSNALFLPEVYYLNLQIDDATISRFYLPIDYLDLSRVRLRPSSRFSQSSFFQRGKTQSPAGSGK